jgi:integrase
LFTDELGRPLHPQSVTTAFRRHVTAAGLRVIPLHGLRHTAATLAFAAGVHGKATSARLGHASVGFTLDTYTDAVSEVEVDAAQRVASLIYPSGSAGAGA